ncbi:MAG TPA: AI-2E family transporter [Verrucomicrobiae bacterium]
MNNVLDGKQDLHVTHRVQIEITWKSIFRLLMAGLLTYALILLWPIFKILILAILMAVAMYPMITWAARKGWPEWAGYLLAITTLFAVVVGCFVIIGPMVFHQVTALGDNLPKLRDQIIAQLPASGPVHQALQNSISPGTVADSRLLLQKTLLVIETTLGGLVSVIVVIALAVYLIIDGPHALVWLVKYIPVAERARVSEALAQISRLISSYVAGQCLISALAAAYLFLVLSVLGVPMALLLGIVAGICDILPIIGFFIAVFLAMAIGLAISPATAALIFVLYGAYHLFENFVIIPRVYGRKLRLSKLAVPLAVAAGGLLAGIVGAIAVLPLVAAYPVIERLWLAPKLEPNAAKAHEEGAA